MKLSRLLTALLTSVVILPTAFISAAPHSTITSDFPDPLRASNVSNAHAADAFMHDVMTRQTALGFQQKSTSLRRLLLVNGTADDSFNASFFPEEGMSVNDYVITVTSNDTEIFNSTRDVVLSRVDSTASLNVTAVPDFNSFPGFLSISLEARRVADNSLFDTMSIDFLIAGLVLHDPVSREILTGFGRSFKIPDYQDVVGNPHRELGVFVQFLNGTSSDEIVPASAVPTTVSWASVQASPVSLRGQISWDPGACSLNDAKRSETGLSLREGCGMGFGPGRVDGNPNGRTFALDFRANRAGTFSIVFHWPGFIADSGLLDEELYTFLTVEISGTPPTVVTRISPENPFSSFGGEELNVELINAENVAVLSFNVNAVPFWLIEGSRKAIGGPSGPSETLTFRTEPGNGKLLPWTITGSKTASSGMLKSSTSTPADVIDETGFLFSYDDMEPILSAVNPSKISEDGGALLVLSGFFPSFNPSVANHAVHIGNVAISPESYELFSPTELQVIVPPKAEIGSAWKYEVGVQIGDVFTNTHALEFTPTSLKIKGQIFGVSLDEESEFYVANVCGYTSCVITVTEQTETGNRTYLWSVLDMDQDPPVDILLFPNSSTVQRTADLLVLPNELLSDFNKKYVVRVLVTVGQLNSTHDFPVVRSKGTVLGVALLEPEKRSISSPPVNLRVIAKVDLQECNELPSSLVYEWEYENKSKTLLESARAGVTSPSVHDSSLTPQYQKFVFSFENNTGTYDNTITPTRLGRELIIPREFLSYGTHRIRLTIKENDKPLFGVSRTSVTITEAPLIAKIGSGQLKRVVISDEDLTLSAELSYDPDVVQPSLVSKSLAYEWSCALSLYFNYSNTQLCHSSLLPEDKVNSPFFKVSSDAIAVASQASIEGPGGSVYLRYTVTVKKGDRESSVVQEVALSDSTSGRLSRYDRINVVNSRGEAVNPSKVEFWDDVIIEPVAVLGTQWKFRLELPWRERSRFLAGDVNLISRPGYYVVRGNSAPSFQRVPLGIRRDKLKPQALYQFLVSFQEGSRITNDVVVQFKTVEMPDLVFPPFSLANGNTSTVFQAIASTSFNGNASFSYQFYLLDKSGRTREYCIDGCTGGDFVRFQIAKPGQYVVQCRLIAANGKTLLSVKNNTEIISVLSTNATGNVTKFNVEIEDAYHLGDDGGVNQKGFFVTESIHEGDGQVVALSDEAVDDFCANYTRKWVGLSRQIIGNELPNTASTRNYVILAANYARLRCVESEDTMYDLASIVEQSIARTPPEEVLTTLSYSQADDIPMVEIEKELLRFYNFSMSRALSMIGQGSSRQRLLSPMGAVNNLILDLTELWMKHMTTTATSGRVCGWEASYSSGTLDGEPDNIKIPRPLLPNSGNGTYLIDQNNHMMTGIGLNTVRVAVMCNAEQGRSLSTPNARFEWCDAVYSVSGSVRKLITLAETFDYPYVSGIQGANHSDTKRVVAVDITTLGAQNQLVTAMSSETLSAVAAQSDGTTENVAAGCYRIQMAMSQSVMSASSRSNGSEKTQLRAQCQRNVPFRMWPRKVYGRQVSEPFQDGLYQRWTDGVWPGGGMDDAVNGNVSTFVEARSNELGVFGAYRAPCSSFLGGGDGSALAGTTAMVTGMLIGMLILIIIIVGTTYALVAAAVRAAERKDEEADLLAANEAYVERDIFGRQDVRLHMEDDESVAESATGSVAYSERSGMMTQTDTDLSYVVPQSTGFLGSGLLASMLSSRHAVPVRGDEPEGRSRGGPVGERPGGEV